MSEPKISVVIPVYNVEPYLRRCLDSVAGQTYENLEIILVDDGSADESGAICDEYAARDERFIVLHTANGGAYAARNRALDAATGEYIGFVDGDDWIEPEMYERLLALALESGADMVQCEMVNEGACAQLRGQALGGIKRYTRDELTGAMFREELSHGLINKLFKAGVWHHMRFPEEYYHADAMMMARAGTFCGSFIRTDEALYHYNTGSESITRGKKTVRHVKSLEKLFEVYASAATEPAGSFFICREIPSGGRLIPPSGEISVGMAVRHIRYMHGIFCAHWDRARQTEEYRRSPGSKRALWHIYRRCPVPASVMSWAYARAFKR